MDAGELLRRRGLLNETQLDQLRQGNGDGASLVEKAIALGYVKEEAALQTLGEEVGLDFIDLRDLDVDLSLLDGFPHKLIHRQLLFPIRRHNGQLLVATSDPFDLYPIDEVGAATGVSVVPVLASRGQISSLIKKYMGVGSETVEDLMEQYEDREVELLDEIETDGSELSEMAQEASVVRLVNEILLEAVDAKASDVHIESQATGLVIRYRIDGILQPQPVPPEINRFQAAIISRLKIMSHLNIAERRLPQDGRIKLRVSGREIDVRVSVIPMIHGEGLVLRILDKGAMRFELQSLGMSPATYSRFSELIRLPHGIILVTGPTGSGKSTTLYSSLIEINRPDIKIITAEDPVEYQLQGINQIQVHPKIGLTFASSLRSILRHDPDVVLIGEIRDLETAENAIQAALTGHLVFSTLHTNDAASSFARLSDMGIEPFLVASTIEAVMAQRLVRRLCTHCREPYQPDPSQLPNDFPVEELGDRPLYRTSGCTECRHLGYMGRVGLYELLLTDNRIRQLAHDRASTWLIKKCAMENKMTTLREDGWHKVIHGVTTIDEVLRITKGDHDLNELEKMTGERQKCDVAEQHGGHRPG